MFVNRLAALLTETTFTHILIVDELIFGFAFLQLRPVMRSAHWIGGLCWAYALLPAGSRGSTTSCDFHRIVGVHVYQSNRGCPRLPLESTAGAGEGLHVRTACRIEGDAAEVEVIDSGPGIPAEAIDRIFEPFFSTKRGEGGTGLGLAICRAMVEANEGRIEVRSDGGNGTTVAVTLRLAAQCSAEPSQPPSPEEPAVEARSLRVLVVDDEALVARAMCRVLADHDVVTALSGRDGLALLVDRGQDFDVVICDVLLPDVSGAEVHERAVEARPELSRRFLFVTGGAVDDEARAFLGREDVRWLSKPVDPAVLEQEVARVASERTVES